MICLILDTRLHMSYCRASDSARLWKVLDGCTEHFRAYEVLSYSLYRNLYEHRCHPGHGSNVVFGGAVRLGV